VPPLPEGASVERAVIEKMNAYATFPVRAQFIDVRDATGKAPFGPLSGDDDFRHLEPYLDLLSNQDSCSLAK